MRTSFAISIATCTLLVCRTLPAAIYQLADLGTLGGATSQAFGLNVNGDVVGSSVTSNGQTHAFLYHNGSMTDMGLLNASDNFSQAQNINDSGVAVGDSENSGVKSTAFYYSGGQMHFAGDLGGNFFDFAQGINNAGQIVGISADKNGVTHAFMSYNGVVTDLGSLTATGGYSNAASINSAGHVTGFSTDSNGLTHAFLYKNGKMTDLGTLPGGTNTATAFAINNQDQVVGYSTPTSSPLTDAVLWQNGTILDLGTLPGVDSSFGRGLNDFGTVVGGSGHAFIWTSDRGMQDLNGMLDNSGARWTLLIAYDVNNRGQIAGMGIDPAGNQQAFLLTPVPEPSMPVLVVSAAAIVGCWGCRRRRRFHPA